MTGVPKNPAGICVKHGVMQEWRQTFRGRWWRHCDDCACEWFVRRSEQRQLEEVDAAVARGEAERSRGPR